jgi:hypothetical protein
MDWEDVMGNTPPVELGLCLELPDANAVDPRLPVSAKPRKP